MRLSPSFLRLILAAVPMLVAPALSAAPDADAPKAAEQADAGQKIVPAKFMRFTEDGHGGGRFETAVVTFKNKDGVSVQLVGAIHIGEKSYYDALNKSFENDDAVLYELVSPKGINVPARGAKSDNPINQLQHVMKDVLNLDFQLDDIDYSKGNFVHADMDAQTFQKMQEERGETFQALLLKQLMKAFTKGDDAKGNAANAQENPEQILDTAIEMLTRPDMERQIKLAVAKQLDKIDDSAMGLDGPNGSVILTERNKVALKVLEQTIERGKKKIAVFYGAAHLPDMSARLKKMGFTPVAVKWNTAWDLAIRPDQPSGVEKMLKELIHALDDDGN
ncbi:MAG TPA: TraB/GumN family protein [Tepidisphaeraceae bacterium]|nr:TraB/GumN family protein [Tepidisphaeraceae bacterium]